MTLNKKYCIIGMLAASLRIATAQAPVNEAPLSTYSTKIADARTEIAKGSPNYDALASRIVSVESENQLGLLTYLAGYTSFHSFLRTVEETLSNHQPGSTTSSSGSTSLVSKASVPEVIGLAVDGGALTQSSSGNTSTFTGNAGGLFRYLSGREVFPYCPYKVTCESSGSAALRRLTGSISLDNTSSGTTTAATSGTTSAPSSSTAATSLSGSNWRMSSWGVQYQIPLGKLDLAGPDFRKAWDTQMDTLAKAKTASPIAVAAMDLNVKIAAALDPLEKSKDYQDWRRTAATEMAVLLSTTPTPSQAAIETKLRAELDKLAKIITDKKYISTDQLTAALAASKGFFATRNDVLTVVEGHLPGLSLAYTNAHPLNQANVSNFKLIFQIQPKPGKLSLTANVAADFYDSLPAGNMVGRWRDLQTSAQADITLPSQYGSPVLSFAGYFQYMATKAVLQIPAGNTVPGTDIVLPGPAGTLLAPKGNIGIAQALLTFPVKSTGAKIPVGISWASRTELLTGSVIRAHIGLNFDFDSLFMK